jgi:putative inorganic carbon (HCO3(-)) transporter
MNQPAPFLSRSALWLAFASAGAILISIAASQILLALAVMALLVSGEELRLPPIKLPLVLFMVGTVLSLAFSGEAAAGLPGIRKFFVFLILLVVFSTFRDLAVARFLMLSWAGLGGLVALRGVVQFAGKVKEARQLHQSFYDYYVPGDRITGFMGHWMTFSGQEMFALAILIAFLLFAPAAWRRGWVWLLCGALMATALLLGMTRSSWVGFGVAALYLFWFWRRWLVAVVPIAAILAVLLAPVEVRERLTSITNPRQGVDSNQHRFVAWSTGLRIIEKHPLLGLGPEGVKLHFDEYVPADIPRPLPVGWYGHLHNIYLQFAAERGIPTMLVLMWMLLKIGRDFLRGLRSLPPGRSNRRFLLHAGMAVLLATMAAGFFEHNLGDSEVLTMFLVAVACGYLAVDPEIVEETVPVHEGTAVA